MKIGILHYAAPPVVGGVESVIGHHAGLMATAGHEVTIFAGRGSQTDTRIPFVSFPLLDSRHPQILEVKSKLDAGHLASQFDQLVGEIDQWLTQALSNTDVLLAHNVCSLHKNLPLTAAIHRMAKHSTGPRLILWHHDLAWTTPRYQNELHEGYPWNLLRTPWPEVTQVVVSVARQQELASLYGLPAGQIQVIPNGLDAGKFLQLGPQTQKLVNDLDLLSASPLILLPVRITPRKNIEQAMRVLAGIRKVYPEAVLVVTGPPGPHNPANAAYFSSLTALRSELDLENAAVFLTEQVAEDLPDAAIAELYRLADILFLPSREEGFGIPILEAGLRSIPIFCSDIPPFREIGLGFVTYFHPDEDSEQVAERVIQSLLQNSVFGLRQQVKREYRWERIYRDRIQPLLLEQKGGNREETVS